jgi:uncharacterized membrane protein YphA (DoxX/SURF4 family)
MRCNPSWVAGLLGRRWVLPLTQGALISAYFVGGVDKLANFNGAILEQEHFGLHPGVIWAALAVVVEIGGSLCVTFNCLV